MRRDLLKSATILKALASLPADINIASVDVTDGQVIVTFDVADAPKFPDLTAKNSVKSKQAEPAIEEEDDEDDLYGDEGNIEDINFNESEDDEGDFEDEAPLSLDELAKDKKAAAKIKQKYATVQKPVKPLRRHNG